MTVDTSAEAVERLAAVFDRRAVLRAWAFAEPTEGMRELSLVAATLRALAQERDAAVAARDDARRVSLAFEAETAKAHDNAKRWRAERDAALHECERLRLGGCARGQTTTQWCAEAVEMMAQRDAIKAEVERMREALTAAHIALRRCEPWDRKQHSEAFDMVAAALAEPQR